MRTAFLPLSAGYRERVFCIRNGMTERPVCRVCTKGFLKFDRRTDSYGDGCCHTCTLKSSRHRGRMVAKYGFESPNSSPVVKEKKARSMLDRYGVDNPSKVPEIQEKKV